MNHDRTASLQYSSVLLGCLLALAGGAVIVFGGYKPSLENWSQPGAVAAAMIAVGLLLNLFSLSRRLAPPARWSWWQGAIAGVLLLAGPVAFWFYRDQLVQFGPAEFAAVVLLFLAGAIALARRSHLAAAGMVLAGLLLAVVGIDITTGAQRLTLGFNELLDGISWVVLVAGLLICADALIALISPSRWIGIYGWLDESLKHQVLPLAGNIVIRLLALFALAASVAVVHYLNLAPFDLVLLGGFTVAGLICIFFGWNRLVLLLAFFFATLLEENIRRTLILSRGELSIFMERPESLYLLVAAAALLALAFLLWIVRAARHNGQA